MLIIDKSKPASPCTLELGEHILWTLDDYLVIGGLRGQEETSVLTLTCASKAVALALHERISIAWGAGQKAFVITPNDVGLAGG